MNRLSFAFVVALAGGVLAAIPDDVSGCATVLPRGGTIPPNFPGRIAGSERTIPGPNVQVADESALIIWDEKSKTEHFVRGANFRVTGYDFGFLVPTPNRPVLEPADDSLFTDLAAVTAPAVERREEIREVPVPFEFGCALSPKNSTFSFVGSAIKPGSAMPQSGVQVLEQKRVGDYDATVLMFRKGEGDTPEHGSQELANWLAKHGYEAPPAVDTWLAKYVTDGWCITAFKIAPDAKQNGPKTAGATSELRAKPVWMSFKADRPFYPYREPATEQAKPGSDPRLLRVFFAATRRYAGKLGDGSKPWPGQTVWAGSLPDRWAGLLDHATDGLWLTEFEDRSSPRPGTDEVYFEPSADASPVARPPHVIINTRTVQYTPWWHAGVFYGLPVALVIGLLAWRRFRAA